MITVEILEAQITGLEAELNIILSYDSKSCLKEVNKLNKKISHKRQQIRDMTK